LRIIQVYSHLNGQEFILVHHAARWTEITTTIERVDAAACRTKLSKERGRRGGTYLYSPVEMNKYYKRELKERSWSESRTNYWVTSDHELIRKTMHLPPNEQLAEIREAGKEAIASYNQTDFVKDRIAIEVQFGKYSFVAFDLFVKHMAFYVGNVIDVGIEILPMKELSDQMSSGIAYFERELYNVIRQGRGVPAVPLVLIGVAP
jgi:hypothetical protein